MAKQLASSTKNNSKRIALGALLTLATPSVAEARSQGSMLGHSSAADAPCFNDLNGNIRQTCSTSAGSKLWMMPLILDNNNGLNVVVGARGNGASQDVICQSFSVDQNGGSVRFGGQQWTVFADRRVEQLSLPVSPHGFGTTWVGCVMRGNTQLFTVNY